jgi:hypothetical protein
MTNEEKIARLNAQNTLLIAFIADLIEAGDEVKALLGKGLVDDKAHEALERWDEICTQCPGAS